MGSRINPVRAASKTEVLDSKLPKAQGDRRKPSFPNCLKNENNSACEGSNANGATSARWKLLVKMAESDRTVSITSIANTEPSQLMPKTETVRSKRKYDRSEDVLPTFIMFKINMNKPIQVKLCEESVDSMLVTSKSNMKNTLSTHASPRTGIVESSLPRERKDGGGSRAALSKTRSARSIWAKLRSSTRNPDKVTSTTNRKKTKPRRLKPINERAKSSQPEDLSNDNKPIWAGSITKREKSSLKELLANSGDSIIDSPDDNTDKPAREDEKIDTRRPAQVGDCRNSALSICKESRTSTTKPK